MTKAPKAKKTKASKKLDRIGIHEIDILSDKDECTLAEYITAVSAYVRDSSKYEWH